MISIDPDQFSKSELKDLVRENRDDVEELQEVKISQNKTPLRESIEDALAVHLNQLGSIPEEGMLDELKLDASSLSPSPSGAIVSDEGEAVQEDAEDSEDVEEGGGDTDAGAGNTTEADTNDTSYGSDLQPLDL